MTKHDTGEWLIGLQEPEYAETGTIILTNTLVKIYVKTNSMPSGEMTIALIGHNGNQNVNENAKRIVECVNSMDGIDEPLKLMERVNKLRKILSILNEQNELLFKAIDITLNPNKYPSMESELQIVLDGINDTIKLLEQIKQKTP